MRLAARGRRDLDDGEIEISDQNERARVRRQARSVHAQAIAFGAALTLAALLLPQS